MKDDRARLTIQQETSTLSIEFYWSGLEKGMERDTIPVSQDWSQSMDRRFEVLLNQLIFEDVAAKEIRTSNFKPYLMNIGRTIWSDVFERSDQIRAAIKQFDGRARSDGLLASNCQFTLVIDTDIFFIPWELCLIPQDEGEDLSPWDPEWFEKPICQRYHLFRCLRGCKPRQIQRSVGERKSVLLLQGLPTPEEMPIPSKEQFRKDEEYQKAIKSVEEYEKVYNELFQLIDSLKAQGVDVDCEHTDPIITDNKIRGWENKYDLILFVGPFREKEGDQQLGQMILSSGDRHFDLDVAHIQSGEHYEPVVFLDGCKTDNVSYSEVGEYIDSTKSVAHRLLEDGASAFAGTIQKIEPVVGARFATEFLHSVFNEGWTLAKALYEARLNCYNFFGEERHKVSSLFFNLQTTEDCEEQLFKSFRYGFKQTTLRLIYPSVVDRYFAGFQESIYPSGVPSLLQSKATFGEVVGAVIGRDELGDEIKPVATPFIADWPILAAAKNIAETRGDEARRLVIVGGLFRLKRELSEGFLYYREDRLENAIFSHPNFLATVTTLALMYFDTVGLADRFTRRGIRRTYSYNAILKGALECITTNGYDRFDAFILAGPYETRFERELKKLSKLEDREEKQVFGAVDSETGDEVRIVRIDLSRFLFKVLQQEKSQYLVADFLPASVLVARYKDVNEHLYMYKEVMDKWQNWRTGILRPDPTVLATQDVIVTWSEVDQRAVIDFTKFVEDKLGKYLQIPSLGKQDFFWVDIEKKDIYPELGSLKEQVLERVHARVERVIRALEEERINRKREATRLLAIPGSDAEAKRISKKADALVGKVSKYQEQEARFRKRVSAARTFQQVEEAEEELKQRIPELE